MRITEEEVEGSKKRETSSFHLAMSWGGNKKRGKGKGPLEAPSPAGTHQVEGSPEQGLYLGCSHGWYRGCTPDSRWVGGYGCSVLACSMESFREGEHKFNEDTKLRQQSHIHGHNGHQKISLAAASQQPSLACHKPIVLCAKLRVFLCVCYKSAHLRGLPGRQSQLASL